MFIVLINNLKNKTISKSKIKNTIRNKRYNIDLEFLLIRSSIPHSISILFLVFIKLLNIKLNVRKKIKIKIKINKMIIILILKI